ncbi:hypothetical protein PTKIN_Ptkin05aG0082100 [Pterospermum kingtungense]
MALSRMLIKDGQDEDKQDNDDEDAGGDKKQSRKAMLKLGSWDEVCFREVFKSPNSETYVIFGEAKIEDLSSQLCWVCSFLGFLWTLLRIRKKLMSGIEPGDSDLVMTEAWVSKSMAVKAFKTHNGDIVSAIMKLHT